MVDPLIATIMIIAGGVLVGVCVHFIPASATGAMAAATGIATGPSMLSAGAGLTGIYAAAYSIDSGLALVIVSGAVGSALMLLITILCGNIMLAFGIGAPPVSGQTASGKSTFGGTKDIITGFEQEGYASPGTDGHGMPFQTAVSGTIGALMGGAGGAFVFYAVYSMTLPAISTENAVTLAGIVAAGVFLINSVLPAYVLVGKTEGMFDMKIRSMHRTFISCLVTSSIVACVIYAVSWLAVSGVIV